MGLIEHCEDCPHRRELQTALETGHRAENEWIRQADLWRSRAEIGKERIAFLERQHRGAVAALRAARQCIIDYNPLDDAGFYDDAVQVVLDQIDAALGGQ